MCEVLTESLTDKDGAQAEMIGLLDGHTVMQARLSALALQEVSLNNKKLRGHTYHHSVFTTSAPSIAQATNPNAEHTHEAVYQSARLTARYIHFYMPSNPEATVELFQP